MPVKPVKENTGSLKKIPYKKPTKRLNVKRVTWEKEKEKEECDLVLSAYSNNLGKPMYVARDPNVKYFRYLLPEEFIEEGYDKKPLREFPVYTYGNNEKRYLGTYLSGNVKNLGKEYYGYEYETEEGPYPTERRFVCWSDDIINAYEKWLDYCSKINKKK